MIETFTIAFLACICLAAILLQFFKNENYVPPTTELDMTQDRLRYILESIDTQYAYYAGGSLCIDNVLPEDDVLVVNLDGECLSFAGNGTMKMDHANWEHAFEIYRRFKGTNEYYNEMRNLYEKELLDRNADSAGGTGVS